MRLIVIWLIVIIALAIAGLSAWRALDFREDNRVMSLLSAASPDLPLTYAPDMIADEPEPVRRFFNHAIAPGTPLHTAVELRLEGQFNMGTKDTPHFRRMFAKQMISYPFGFVWEVVLRTDETWISGSDGAFQGDSWSRFWLMGLLPVARVGGTADHYQSSFGRYAAEAVFWSPASVLPGDNAEWRALGPDLVQVKLTYENQTTRVDLTLDSSGAPVKISFDRWTDANPDKEFRLQRFGGYLSDPVTFDGFTVPTRIIAGNKFETDEYFAFYDAVVISADFGPN